MELSNLINKLNLNNYQIRCLVECLRLYNELQSTFTKEFKEEFNEYAPAYFATEILRGITTKEILKTVKAESRKYDFKEGLEKRKN